jgi:hypothetical protein
VTVQVLLEFLNLCDLIDEVPLQPGVEDTHIWRLSTSGKYSAKSAYNAFFQGSIPFNAWEHIWKSWAPNKCRFFLLLVAHNRCWTADRLARHNLPHPDWCPLCDQAEETIHHLLATCVFARQFWSNLLQQVGLPGLSPGTSEISFDDWWGRVITLAPSTIKGGLNSVRSGHLDTLAAPEWLSSMEFPQDYPQPWTWLGRRHGLGAWQEQGVCPCSLLLT